MTRKIWHKLGEIVKKILGYGNGKYITAQESSKITTDNFPARSKQANLTSKNDIVDFVKKKI